MPDIGYSCLFESTESMLKESPDDAGNSFTFRWAFRLSYTPTFLSDFAALHG